MDQIDEELDSLEAIYGEECLVKPEERSVEVNPNRLNLQHMECKPETVLEAQYCGIKSRLLT